MIDDFNYEVTSCKKKSLLDTKWRVKLYNLNIDGQWDDKGTGNIFISNHV